MQIIHPRANCPEVSATPSTHDTVPLSDAQRLQLLIESVLDHSENYVGQPCPYPLEPEPTAESLLAYSQYDINPRAYPCLEQGEELQLRLEGDILPTAAQCNPFTWASACWVSRPSSKVSQLAKVKGLHWAAVGKMSPSSLKWSSSPCSKQG